MQDSFPCITEYYPKQKTLSLIALINEFARNKLM